MKVSILHTKVLPSFLGGTSRHALPAELIRPSNSASDGALEMLSLLGQELRFERPLSPVPSGASHLAPSLGPN